mmetsp:Transcript_11912/g.24364  ORF Transcript_11912/g.24364 Transcript_11912/m.24364 type:complete len:356 (+) Transcript_11912:3-1070(+)
MERAKEWEGGETEEERNQIKKIAARVLRKTDHDDGQVWTLNVWLLDRRLRGHQISNFVKERVDGRGEGKGNTGLKAGMVWKAASYMSAHAAESKAYGFRFTVEDVMESIERNPGIKQGIVKGDDLRAVIEATLEAMLVFENPSVVSELGNGRWEISYDACEEAIKERKVGQYVGERWGLDAARIFRILREKNDMGTQNLLGSEHISGVAMLPEKVTRKQLHALYTAGMVEFHDFPTSKQHAYTQTIYLWGAETRKVMGAVEDALRTVLVSVRDRRRVYINSDQNEVFDRLRNKSLGGTNSGGKTKAEADEEKNALNNLNILDSWQLGLEDDLLLFEERGKEARGIVDTYGTENFM